MDQQISQIDDRVNGLESSVNSIDDKLNNFIIDQYKFNEVTEKKISNLIESTAKRFLESDTNVCQVQADALNIQ